MNIKEVMNEVETILDEMRNNDYNGTVRIVIKNEQHSLFPQQTEILKKASYGIVELNIPAEGLNKEQILELSEELNAISGSQNDSDSLWVTPVIMSPVPLLMKELRNYEVFHNDKRNKKEVAPGKIIQVVAPEGWELL